MYVKTYFPEKGMRTPSVKKIVSNYLSKTARQDFESEVVDLLKQMKQIEIKNNELEDYTEVVEDFFGFRLSSEAMTTFKEILAKFEESKIVRDNADKVVANLKDTLELVQQTGNASLAKKIQSALGVAEKQAEKASKNREKLRKTLIRVQKKAFPKTVVDKFKPFYKEVKKYLSDIPPLRDASKNHYVNGQWRMMLALTDQLSFGIALTPSGEYRHLFVDNGNNGRHHWFTDLNSARDWFLENGGLKGITLKNNPLSDVLKKRKEIADAFLKVVRYFDGDDISISGNSIEAYTGDSGYYEAYDGDGEYLNVQRVFEKALKKYDKYIKDISVQWYGDGEWHVELEFKQ